MDCKEAMESAYARVDEPLSAGDEKRLTEHLQTCEKCRTEIRRLNRLEDVLRKIPEPSVSRARLRETVDAVSAEVRGRGRARGVGMWIAVAAAVLIAAGIGLFWRRPVTSEEKPASKAPELAAREVELRPAPGEEPVLLVERLVQADLPDRRKLDARIREILLVRRLVQADLALSEADGPGQKAAIFCAMSRDVLSMLRELVGQSDGEGMRTLGRGYTRLVQEGVLPNVRLASGEPVSQVIASLRGNCEVLETLVADMEVRERTLLAEALSASKECLSEAEGKLGL